MKNLKISSKLIILITLTSVIMAFIGIYGLLSLKKINEGLHTMYVDRVVPLKQLKKVSDAYAVNFVDVVNKANIGILSWDEALRKLEVTTTVMNTEWKDYLNTKIEGDEKILVNQAQQIREEYSLPAYEKAKRILNSGKGQYQSSSIT